MPHVTAGRGAGAMMVLTLKLVTSAVCYQDGLKKAEVRQAA